jgi:hypothetical protein
MKSICEAHNITLNGENRCIPCSNMVYNFNCLKCGKKAHIGYYSTKIKKTYCKRCIRKLIVIDDVFYFFYFNIKKYKRSKLLKYYRIIIHYNCYICKKFVKHKKRHKKVSKKVLKKCCDECYIEQYNIKLHNSIIAVATLFLRNSANIDCDICSIAKKRNFDGEICLKCKYNLKNFVIDNRLMYSNVFIKIVYKYDHKLYNIKFPLLRKIVNKDIIYNVVKDVKLLKCYEQLIYPNSKIVSGTIKNVVNLD